jgi:nucleoside-diphosphate-sugar epimerase
MEILVTGASGFIGRHLARALTAQGHQVKVLLRKPSTYVSFNGVKSCVGDLTDADSLYQAVEGVDLVYHLAAIRDRWGLSYQDYYAVNVEGTRHLLDAAVEQGARFVHCSSVGVLGYPGVLDIDEDHAYRPQDGKYNYHHTKALAEQLTLEYAQKGRLAAIVVRPVITYGPGDEYGMVTKLLTLLATGRFVPVGNGQNHVHLAYITDTVRGIILAGECDQAIGRIYIIPGSRPIATRELIAEVCALLECPTPRWHVPLAPAKVAAWMFESVYTLHHQLGLQFLGSEPFLTRDKIDTLTINRGFCGRRAEQELGYHPTIDYPQGLALTVAWARQAGLLS